MKNTDDILNSLLEKMNQQKQEFEEVEKELASYIEQSKVLQQKYDEANTRREQIRGKYTGYYTMYNEIKSENVSKEEVENSKENSAQVIETKSKAKKKTENKKETLTEEEKATLTSITNSNIHNTDVPDYLQGEYNKLKK